MKKIVVFSGNLLLTTYKRRHGIMLISITGPSGVGKGFLKNHLQRWYPQMRELPWVTTRPLRDTDTNRIHLEHNEFSARAARGELSLTQELFGHRYGIETELLRYDHDALLLTELHIDNLRAAQAAGFRPLAIAIVPASPSLIQERLAIYRTSEPAAENAQRLQAATIETAQIIAQRSLFHAVVEVSKENEKDTPYLVQQILAPHLKGWDYHGS